MSRLRGHRSVRYGQSSGLTSQCSQRSHPATVLPVPELRNVVQRRFTALLHRSVAPSRVKPQPDAGVSLIFSPHLLSGDLWSFSNPEFGAIAASAEAQALSSQKNICVKRKSFTSVRFSLGFHNKSLDLNIFLFSLRVPFRENKVLIPVCLLFVFVSSRQSRFNVVLFQSQQTINQTLFSLFSQLEC